MRGVFFAGFHDDFAHSVTVVTKITFKIRVMGGLWVLRQILVILEHAV